MSRWIDTAARTLGVEADVLQANYGQLQEIVKGAGPALLYIDDPVEPRLMAIVGGRRGMAHVLTHDHRVVRIPAVAVEHALLRRVYACDGASADAILNQAAISERRRDRARKFLLLAPMAHANLEAGWLVRLPPSAPFMDQIRNACLRRPFVSMILANVVIQLLSILSWWMIGAGAMEGHLERGWLIAWALVLFTTVPVRVLSAWWQGVIVVGIGALMKRRMLLGALRLDPSEIRHQGMGQVLGCVLESESAESLAVSGGFASAMAVVDVLIALPVLLGGPGGALSAAVFLAWVVLTGVLSFRLFGRALLWSQARIKLTDELVEKMVGHRTRLAQEPPPLWHVEEDRSLSDYVECGERLDRTNVWISGALSRGFLVAGMLALAPAFIEGRGSPGLLAVGVGGVVLGRSALSRLAGGIASLAYAIIAWRKAGQLFHAAARPEVTEAASAAVLRQTDAVPGEALIDAHDVVFRYRREGAPVLSRASLRINAGDRILVEGPSGGGKSTFASLLTGLKSPESGLLLLAGLDRETVGAHGWRRRVVAAPQFHENHVLSNTFAFNLLMGRGWPPAWADIEEAEKVCHELGLGPLLARMPGGLMQMVGETGWQLSHGEQSRLFIARALLQRAELVVLDESFAALDPETLSLSLKCVFARAKTLLVIAHP